MGKTYVTKEYSTPVRKNTSSEGKKEVGRRMDWQLQNSLAEVA